MAGEHPIQGLMKTAMENIKEMVDVNTIVGEPVETNEGSVIIPISKVGFGFASGGSDFNVQSDEQNKSNEGTSEKPFGGGSGGGVSITPVAFLIVGSKGVQVLPLDSQAHIYERIIDLVSHSLGKIQNPFKGKENEHDHDHHGKDYLS